MLCPVLQQSPLASRLLQGLDRIDVDQPARHHPVFLRIGDHDLRLRDGHALGMVHFVLLAIGEANHERLKVLPANELPNRFHAHGQPRQSIHVRSVRKRGDGVCQ